MSRSHRLPLACVVVALGVLTAAGCSSLLGLGPDAHEDTSWRDAGSGPNGSEGGPGDDGATPASGQPCVFDRSKFDDGCVFGP